MRPLTFVSLLFIAIIIHIMIGKVYLSPNEVIECLNINQQSLSCEIIYKVRLPRTILSVLVGVLLALSGYILQQISRNPIFEPGILGINAGSLFMITFIQLFTGVVSNTLFVMFISWCGGMLVMIIVILLSKLTHFKQALLPILGLLCGQFLTSVVYFILIIRSDVSSSVMSKTFGSLNGTSLEDVYALLPFALIGVFLAYAFEYNLKYFQISNITLTSIGFNTRGWTLIYLMIAVLLASITVPIIGSIGFVGLMAPHFGTKMSKKHPLFYTAIIGALILILSDIISAGMYFSWFKDINAPIGAILSIIGAPYFVYLYFKDRPLKR